MSRPLLWLPILLLAACGSTGRRAVSTDQAPQAIGPYSPAIDTGRYVFLSGQIPLDPATGQMIAGDIRAQTERVLRNLEAVLAAAGLRMEHVVKTTVFLVDLNEFTAMNEVYARYFPKSPPARATVQVAALPKGARVEIEAVAAR